MNIVFLSTHSEGLSLSKVISYISKDIQQEYDCYLLALDMSGSENIGKDDLAIIPCFRSKYIQHNVQFVGRMLEFIQPQLVVVLHDLSMLTLYFNPLLNIQNRGSKLVAFLPIDGELVNLGNLHPLLSFDHLVLYSNYALESFKRVGQKLIDQKVGYTHLPNLSVIQHGVNTKNFFPHGGIKNVLEKTYRIKAKMNAFPEHPQVHNATIVFNGNRAWDRKRIDLTIKGFAHFKKRSTKNIFLYLHLPQVTELESQYLINCIEESEVKDFIIIRRSNEMLPIEQLNWIYNACEIGINTAMGEGWGLVSCEHAVTGAAQIVPGHTHFKEVWGEAGVFLESGKETQLEKYPYVKFHEVSIESISHCISKLIDSTSYLNEKSLAAYDRFKKSEYQWGGISNRWKEILNSYILEEVQY